MENTYYFFVNETGPFAAGRGDTLGMAAQRFLANIVAHFGPQEGWSEPVKKLHYAILTGEAKSHVDGMELAGEYLNLATEVVSSSLESDGEFRARFDLFCEGHADEAQRAEWVKRNCPQLIKTSLRDVPGFKHLDWYEITKEIAPTPPTTTSVVTAAGGRSIPDDILAILKGCTTRGNRLYLPGGTLSRSMYTKVNDVLVSLGGKWVGGKTKAHVFEEDPGAILDVATSTGTYVSPKDFGYFPTPESLANRVIEEADIEPGMTILEPSAGRASLALPALKACGGDPSLINLCELLPSNIKRLRELGFTKITEGDFLQMVPEAKFDRVIMNPPFSGGQDVAHIMHASKFLKSTGKLVAISSPGWEFNSARKFQDFRSFVEGAGAQVKDVERGAFRSAGTDIATRIISFKAENLPWFKHEEAEDLAQEMPAP